ncbi:PFKFB2 [Lepeophtheirus salmonis]|uniref:PFKFB2 n=1 Tax=Lepeophtheirus salmonis TaxID=72036 RepID=A0A7R8CCR9_LEPSM|nr:PFKFB2 [Lepeophtheirus salmonis]CAF2774026.1 PFKFB2 [Lepeophtheirus salmonis]
MQKRGTLSRNRSLFVPSWLTDFLHTVSSKRELNQLHPSFGVIINHHPWWVVCLQGYPSSFQNIITIVEILMNISTTPKQEEIIKKRKRSLSFSNVRFVENMCGLSEQEQESPEWEQILKGIEKLPYKILNCESSYKSETSVIDDPPFRIVKELGISAPCNRSVVYFSRHGESEYNVQDRIGGNPKLTPRGILYARSLAQYFAGNCDIQIWTSTLFRTIMTASYVKSSFTREKTNLLNELHSGYFDGLTYREIEEKFPLEAPVKGGGGGNSINPPLLIVSHQAALRCIFGYLLNLTSDKIPYIVIPQHTIIKVTYMDGHNILEYIRMPVEHVENGVSMSKMKE